MYNNKYNHESLEIVSMASSALETNWTICSICSGIFNFACTPLRISSQGSLKAIIGGGLLAARLEERGNREKERKKGRVELYVSSTYIVIV